MPDPCSPADANACPDSRCDVECRFWRPTPITVDVGHWRRWRSYRRSYLLRWNGPWWAWKRTRRQR